MMSLTNINNMPKLGRVSSSNKYVIVNDCEENKWDDFVKKHPHGNIFQSPYMYKVYQQTTNYYPLKLFAIDENTGELSGILSGVIVYEVIGLFKKFSAHSIIQGGPLVLRGLDNILIPLLITEHDKLCRKKAVYNEIRNLYDERENFQELGNYIYEDYLDYLIDLNQSEEALWYQMSKSRRKDLKEAIKQKITIEEIQNQQTVSICYRLLKETYRNAKIPLADITLFKSAFNVLFPRKMIRFSLAKIGGNYIGTDISLLYKDVVYAWYIGISREARVLHLQPSSLMNWNELKWGRENGFKIFDFGGAGKNGLEYGPREYKKSFGGRLVEYGRHKYIYSPIMMKITDGGFNLYRKFFL